ncbi:MAG: LytTR family DNA-binding domain-containing protein [Lachnospiraceae bacterium]|nr:LytTR family DNA-binding domain-containing protein [Lachnospiraceae bacterium]MDD7176750.1 LytTR family DNA-binding domain-containing protein [bacterium]MDY5516009.1 LytTR family DNA-binding domain-containing protein [Lachnospiraceae bacterium]
MVMIVSICDDNAIGREVLRALLLEYKKQREITDLKILEYDSPVALEKDLDHIESDLYLLDIFFPDGNGIELAREIRLRYHQNPIVFITSSEGDTMNAFNVFALRYFVKPVRPRPFFETLDYAVARMKADPVKYFMVNTIEGKQKLRFSSIMYVERKNQVLHITTNTGKVYESVTLRESFANKLQPLLAEDRFVQTHVSFVVNLDAVDVYQKDQMTMQDGRHIPISRNFSTIVKERYLSYFC